MLPRVTRGQPGSPRVTQRVWIKPSCPLYLLSVWFSGKGQTGLHPRGIVRACGLRSGVSSIVSNSNMASSWTSELGQPQRPVWKDGQWELAGRRGGRGAPGGPSEGRSPGHPQKPSFLEGALTPHVGGSHVACRRGSEVTARCSATPGPGGVGGVEPQLCPVSSPRWVPGVGPPLPGAEGCPRALLTPASPAASPQQPLAVVQVTLVSMRAPSAEATLHQVGPPLGRAASSLPPFPSGQGPPRGPMGDLVGSGGWVRFRGTRRVGD